MGKLISLTNADTKRREMEDAVNTTDEKVGRITDHLLLFLAMAPADASEDVLRTAHIHFLAGVLAAADVCDPELAENIRRRIKRT